jgi:hypothetical protein
MAENPPLGGRSRREVDMSDFWWGFLAFMIYIPLITLWCFTLIDLFRRYDLSGVAKILWAFAIVFLPLIGMFVYFASRPSESTMPSYGGAGRAVPYA